MNIYQNFAESSPHGGAFWNIADFVLVIFIILIALLVLKFLSGDPNGIAIKKQYAKRRSRKDKD